MPQHQPRVRRAAPINSLPANASFAPARPASGPDGVPDRPAPVLHSFSALPLSRPGAPLQPDLIQRKPDLIQRKPDLIQRDEADDPNANMSVMPDPSSLVCSPDRTDPAPAEAAAPTSPIGPALASSSSHDAGGDAGFSVPQLSTPVNDALGVGLGIAGLVPGPIGTAATLAGGAQSATQGPTDPSDPHYAGDKFAQDLGLATAAGSLLGVEAAGPIGLVGAGGMAVGHGAEWLGDKMIEEGMQNNPGQFGPDPLDQLSSGQQGY